MDPTDLGSMLPLIPPAWIAAFTSWAPYLLAALAITTIVAHGGLPIARRIEDWARGSAATWDDTAARRLVEVLAWLAGATSAIWRWMPRLAMGGLEGRDAKPQNRRPTTGGGAGLGLLLIALAGSAMLHVGCGASALATQARAAQVTAIATGAAGEVVDAARDHALDAVEAAHPIRGPERDAALDAEAERWRPAGQALDAIRAALVTWIASIEAARVVGDRGASALWPQILALGGQVAALYARIASLARELGADVPALELGGLLGTTGGAR